MARLILLILCSLIGLSPAHQIAEMTIRIEASETGFLAVAEADAAYMLPAFRGDADMAAQDLAWLRNLEPADWDEIQRETELFLRDCLRIDVDGSEVLYQLAFPDFESDPPRFMSVGEAEMLPMIEVEMTGPFDGRNLVMHWEEAFGVVLIVQSGDEAIPIISGYHETILTKDENQEATAVAPSLSGWIHLGFRHIIPDGLDHVLFILGIFFLCPKWKPLLAQSLVFTLAHSVTLGLAAMGYFRLPELWIEAAIAASIAWIGVENLWLKEVTRRRYVLIGVFGLIHGLGFARMLEPLLPTEEAGSLVFSLTGFNVGVELGQVLVLLVAFAVFSWWKEKAFEKARLAGSLLIALAGITMLLQRVLAG